jgi:3-deoxy-D-manno-octulosonic-acid transferase
MILVYNFLQLLLLVIGFPVLFLLVLSKRKYRQRIVRRLGFGLDNLPDTSPSPAQKVIWIHALSIGEVTSALPLVKDLREQVKDVRIVFSATTRTGIAVAQKNIRPFADCIISSPLDLYFSVGRYIEKIQPDLFILVETDFWPNWITLLRRKGVPMLLVNGRISKKSFATYQRFHLFFTPLFSSFSLLSMQTDHDAARMAQLGIPAEKIITLGNLKYDTAGSDDKKTVFNKSDLHLPPDSVIWLCGSTHRGEEEPLLAAFAEIRKEHDRLVLIIAPRDPDRAGELMKIVSGYGFPAARRSSPDNRAFSVLILDTIGELTRCYRLAKVAFIGGSLVPCGGHNPLEAAVYGVPVLFGPHMDDFQEISRDIVCRKAGKTVHSGEELSRVVQKLLRDETSHAAMGAAAMQLIRDNAGVVSRHKDEVRKLLG